MTKKNKMEKFTLKQFLAMFPDDDTCLDYIRNKKYPARIDCPDCGKNALFHRVGGRKSYACDYCGYQISPTAKTIFHKSRTPLTTWFYVIYLMAQTRGGISAKQIERETGVTYKTAWRMCKQIRQCLDENYSPFTGEVEIDESYFGGRKPGKRGRGASGKTAVLGIVERNGRIETRTIPNAKRNTILPIVTNNVSKEANVFTDEFLAYKTLPSLGYKHDTVPHGDKIYVIGNAHTNTIEGFWGNCKNGIKGVYHSVSSDYLQNYLNEYAFRYNRRNQSSPMFFDFLGRAVL
jgi:transposase